MKTLLLEDDLVLSNEIKNFLNSKDIDCDIVFDGDLFFHQLRAKENYDLFILDINVPKINGFDVCKKIRETNQITPILMLTAYGEVEDKVLAFNLGADDYLVKPFHLDELYARIIALHRRSEQPQKQSQVIRISDLYIDIDNKTVKRNDTEIRLTPKEFKLLTILAEANGRVLSKQYIADRLWDYHIETNQNTIEVYINFLRNKIDKQFDKKIIQTKVGFGYYLSKD